MLFVSTCMLKGGCHSFICFAAFESQRVSQYCYVVQACDILPSRCIHTAIAMGTQAKTGLQCESTESDDTVCTSQCSVPTVCLPPPRGVTWEKGMNIQCVYNFLQRVGLLTFGAHAQ